MSSYVSKYNIDRLVLQETIHNQPEKGLKGPRDDPREGPREPEEARNLKPKWPLSHPKMTLREASRSPE